VNAEERMENVEKMNVAIQRLARSEAVKRSQKNESHESQESKSYRVIVTVRTNPFPKGPRVLKS
jgi:hypothetical protein